MADLSSIENLNTTLINMAREDLELDYLKIKNVVTTQLKKIDAYEQQVYELKRQISTCKAMEEHLTSEIEILQTNDKTESETKKMIVLEDEIKHLKQSIADNAQYYESEIIKKDSEIQALTQNLITESEKCSKTNIEESEKYNDEIYDLRSKMEELIFAVTEHELNYSEATQKICQLENKNANLITELNEVTECLNSTKQEFQECTELVRNLQDEIIVMQMDLDRYKSVPLEKAAKGNSLFAEVDDNRVKLQNHISVLNKKYHDAKFKYGNKAQELQKLHIDYAALIKGIENKKDIQDDQSELIESYKRQIKKQDDNINTLEKELEQQKKSFNKIMSGDMKCAQELVSATRNELIKLQHELRSESLALLMREQNCYDAKIELRKWKSESMQLRTEAVILKQTIEQYKIGKNASLSDDQEEERPVKNIKTHNEPVKTLNVSNIKTSMFTYLDDDDWENIFGDAPVEYTSIDFQNKENILKERTNINDAVLPNKILKPHVQDKENEKISEIKTKKVVAFAQNTVEPRTDRAGRKVATISTVHIPSLKRK